MDFITASSELNNKKIVAVFQKDSESYKRFGPRFIGQLVGRSWNNSKELTKTVVSLTILAQNYIAYQIPCEDIQAIAEIFNL